MAYDKALLLKWMELRAEVFISMHAKGFSGRSVDADEVRKEFRVIALELHQIIDDIYWNARKGADTDSANRRNAIISTE